MMKKNPNLSRRNFLKTGVGVVGAGALAAGVGAGSLFTPGVAHTATPATPAVIPLPFARDSVGNPTSTPAATNQTVLDVDDVRVMGWWYYNNGRG